eukprot:CAMPEP_0184306470 /NCGR_PEP_ID=MMETSP1049-20130417/15461_1 /TAXON_ID=77928 /ORGANISM="Proteomonas sulcata, Strain CCMP704" /LENGTH=501 /DNA_ID=CAMNT_0026618741 /DNA_START=277 /DNA_END=1782 /DNA_ORIENTATION=+
MTNVAADRQFQLRQARHVASSVKMVDFMASHSNTDKIPDIDVCTYYPPAERIVAVGDVHGDVKALLGCMKIANLIDDDENWIGGTTHFVQVGDILDRGDHEKSCLDVLAQVKDQAVAAGGDVHVLLGNHEIMNVDLDFRYVTPGAWSGWDTRPKTGTLLVNMAENLATLGFPVYMKPRVLAFRPGGAASKELSKMKVAIQIGDTVLVHAGLRKKHLAYGLERINKEAAAWLEGAPRFRGYPKPGLLDEVDSPVWARLYSVPQPKESTQGELEAVLGQLNARRMVVGHTPQLRGINAVVSDNGYEVWRTDTGMSQGMMSGPLECLEILGDGRVHILTKDGVVPAANRMPDVLGGTLNVCDVETGICTPMPQELAKIIPSTEDKPKDPNALNVIGPDQAPAKGLTPEEKEEVTLLKSLDDKTLSETERITRLVEHMISRAAANKDESLTRRTVKEMISKVMGASVVEDKEEYILSEVDRIISMGMDQVLEKFVTSANANSNRG